MSIVLITGLCKLLARLLKLLPGNRGSALPGLVATALDPNWVAKIVRENKLKSVIISGTNGKTTTCNLLAHILAVSGAKVGLATTVNFWIGDKRWVNESKMTTQSPFALQGLLRRMADAKCKYAIIFCNINWFFAKPVSKENHFPLFSIMKC